MLILVTICIFRARILESIILSSAVMEEYKFVNPAANPNSGVKAFTLPPFKNGKLQKEFTFRPPTLPPNWEEMFVAQEKKHIVFLNTIITAILIAIGLSAVLYTVFKKCQYVSSLPRVCFPIYPVSNFLWGTARTDIFVKVINISTAQINLGLFYNMCSPSLTTTDHQLPLSSQYVHNKNLLCASTAKRLAEHHPLQYLSKGD